MVGKLLLITLMKNSKSTTGDGHTGNKVQSDV